MAEVETDGEAVAEPADEPTAKAELTPEEIEARDARKAAKKALKDAEARREASRRKRSGRKGY